MTNAPFALALTLTLALSVLPSPSPTSDEARPIPEWVLAQWKQLVGTWIADNQTYSKDDGIDAFGIEWRWGLGEKSLVGRLYGLRGGEEIGTFWEFREYWHPGEGRLIATQYAADGTFGTGTYERNEDGSTELLQTFYDPTTGAVFRVGHRSNLAGDEHVTRSFDVSEDGEWKPRRSYSWRRRR